MQGGGIGLGGVTGTEADAAEVGLEIEIAGLHGFPRVA
jgi:hypothetical protein